jgi:hypothetical protein
MQAAVEAAFAQCLFHVAVLVKEQTAFVDVAAEKASGHQRDGHHLCGGDKNLGIVAVAHGLQEFVAQAVDGGYGIFHCVLPIQREKVLGGLRIGRILTIGVGGNLGEVVEKREPTPVYGLVALKLTKGGVRLP